MFGREEILKGNKIHCGSLQSLVTAGTTEFCNLCIGSTNVWRLQAAVRGDDCFEQAVSKGKLFLGTVCISLIKSVQKRLLRTI